MIFKLNLCTGIFWEDIVSYFSVDCFTYELEQNSVKHYLEQLIIFFEEVSKILISSVCSLKFTVRSLQICDFLSNYIRNKGIVKLQDEYFKPTTFQMKGSSRGALADLIYHPNFLQAGIWKSRTPLKMRKMERRKIYKSGLIFSECIVFRTGPGLTD